MKIEGIENNTKHYPRINQIKRKKVKNSIPTKWLKLGLTTMLIKTIMNNKSLASDIVNRAYEFTDPTVNPQNKGDIAGGIITTTPFDGVHAILTLILNCSVIISIIFGLILLIKKIKKKKPHKAFLIIFIIAIVIAIGCLIGHLGLDVYINNYC